MTALIIRDNKGLFYTFTGGEVEAIEAYAKRHADEASIDTVQAIIDGLEESRVTKAWRVALVADLQNYIAKLKRKKEQ